MPRPAHAVALACLLAAADAHAGHHVVGRGETLEHVARVHGCTLDAILRANHLKTTLVPVGTIVTIPTCTLRARVRRRSAADARVTPDDGDRRDGPAGSDGHAGRRRAHAGGALDDASARAAAALAVIDGTSWVEPGDRAGAAPGTTSGDGAPATAGDDDGPAPRRGGAASVGAPWHGRLQHGAHLLAGAGFVVRRPSRAWGAPHVVDQVRHAIAEVRALYPRVHTLAIGDLSAEHGGRISEHRSHQSGLDVDVGFYFRQVPAGYPAEFAPASADLDLEATWALLVAFARTAGQPGGVKLIFLDRAVQRRLYDWARARGTPDDELAFLLQYPRGPEAMAGLVRHWPNHANHFHVRFAPRGG